LLDPSLDICLYERHPIYRRDQTLHVARTSLFGTVKHPAFQTMIKKFVGKIKIKDLETQLLNFAKAIGIRIVYREITDCQALAREFPNAKCIIGSDGSHSLVRKQIFGDHFDVQYNLRYFVEVRYHVQKAGSLPWTDWALAQSHCQYFVKESYDEKGKVTLRMFIDEPTYEL